jgi:hypothetical protein
VASPSSPARKPITNAILAQLVTVGFPVGDSDRPTSAHGWSGQPNEDGATFTPWSTLGVGSAAPQRLPGSFGDSTSEWTLAYTVFSTGISRIQAESLADRNRTALNEMTRTSITGENGNWKVQKVACTAIGGVTKFESAFPDYWGQTDSIEIWISKEN